MLDESDDFVKPKVPPAPVRKRPNARREKENHSNDADDFFPFKADLQPSSSSSAASLRCEVCGKQLGSLNEARRLLHVNGCLDNAEAEKKLKQKQEKYANTVDCPMCGAPLQPGPFQIAHVKKCGKSHQIGGSDLLKLVDTQRKIADEKKKIGTTHTKAKVPTFVVPKAKKITGLPRNYQEEQNQLAQALSASMIESAPNFTDTKEEARTSNRTMKTNSSEEANRRKRRRSSFGVVELEPRKCHCDIVNVIHDRFLENFRIRKPGKDWKPLKGVVQRRMSKTAKLSSAISQYVRKLNRLERLADDLLIYSSTSEGDISLLTSENRVVKCHRFILTARSQLAKEISAENTVDLRQYSADVIRCYVKFLYGATVDWSQAETEAIRSLAEKYGPVGLASLLFELEDYKRDDVPPSEAFQSEGIPNETAEDVCSVVPASEASELFPFDPAVDDGTINDGISSDFNEGNHRSGEALNPDTSMNPFRDVVDGDKEDAERLVNPESRILANDTFKSSHSGDMFGFAEKDEDVIVLDESDQPISRCSSLSPSQGFLNINLDSAMLEDCSPQSINDAGPSTPRFNELVSISPLKFNIDPSPVVSPEKPNIFNESMAMIATDQIAVISPVRQSEYAAPSDYSPCFPETSFNYGPSISPLRLTPPPSSSICCSPQRSPVMSYVPPVLQTVTTLEMNATPPSSRKSFGRRGSRVSRPLFVESEATVEEDSFYNTRDDMALFGSPPKPINLPSKFVIGTPQPSDLQANPRVLEQIGHHVKILKTKNITPKPDYSVMNDQELKEHLGRFGLRPMGKKKGIALLDRIYEETHPIILTSPITLNGTMPSTSSSDLVNERQPHRLELIKEANSLDDVLNRSTEGENLEESILNSQLDDDDQEDTDIEPTKRSSNSKKIKEKLPKDAESLQKLFVSWIRLDENSDLYLKMLKLLPIPIEEISTRVWQTTTLIKKISKANLIEVLDRLHVTFILPSDGWKKKHERAANRAAKKKA